MTPGADTESLPAVHQVVVCEPLTWREWVTIRRIRLGWTKDTLSQKAGVTRRWLWRGLECAPDDERFVELSDRVKAKVIAALEQGEAESSSSSLRSG